MRIQKTFIEVLLTLAIISGTTFTYALLADIKVSTNDNLTSGLWNNLVDHSVPSGAVMSFDLESCPTGWSEYTALQGKFIRGADIGAINDPDFASRVGGIGTRKIGSTQSDEFGTHTHDRRYYQNTVGGDGSTYQYASGGATGLRASNAKGGNETRPTNVYLLYCKKD